MLTRNLGFMNNLYNKIADSSLFEKLFGDGGADPSSSKNENSKDQEHDYNDYRINFDSEYAIANPVTSHQGIDDLEKFRKVYNSKIHLSRN